jgi:anti-sigma B factor antagonist
VTAVARPTLRLAGELTVQTAAEQKTLLLAALETADGIAVDLSDIAEVDTAGLQLLLLLRREAAQLGKAFRLLTPSEPVLEVLRIAHLDDRLDRIPPAVPHPRDQEVR